MASAQLPLNETLGCQKRSIHGRASTNSAATCWSSFPYPEVVVEFPERRFFTWSSMKHSETKPALSAGTPQGRLRRRRD